MQMIQLIITRTVWLVAHMGDRRGACKLWWGDLGVKGKLEDLEVYGRII
jgi:hypothetical protein